MAENGRLVRRHDPTFVRSLKLQVSVIAALFLRDIIARFGRHGLGFLWMFLEPMLFSIGVTILWSFMRHGGGNIPVAGFILTGYSALVVLRNMVNRLMTSTSANKGLLYHRNVKVMDLIFARAFMEFVACSGSLFFLTFIFNGLGLMALPVDPLQTIFAWLLYSWCCFSLSMCAAFMGESSEIFERVAHVLMYLAMPLSGAFTMLNWLPPAAQEFLSYSPLVNGVEMLREGYFGVGIAAQYSVGYLIQFNLCMTLVGLILVRSIRRQLIDS
jgi:capsular polysaccharide transport system permease protein